MNDTTRCYPRTTGGISAAWRDAGYADPWSHYRKQSLRLLILRLIRGLLNT